MVIYLNRGLILENALVYLLRKHFEDLKLGEIYQNFGVKVTNSHPFADIYFKGGDNAADSFPCIVVTSESGNKTSDLVSLPTQVRGIAIDKEALDWTIENQDRPGFACPIAETDADAMREHFKTNQYLYGYRVNLRKTEKMSIEIWADNEQLKNELFEAVRLFVGCKMVGELRKLLDGFDVSMSDASVQEQRSNNYNLDFGMILTGGHIGFDLDYSIEQITLDTEVKNLDKDIIMVIQNHIKGNASKDSKVGVETASKEATI